MLPGRRVVISPIALGRVESDDQRLTVSLTKQQVENSPDVDSRNFSREHETSYYDYYGWPYYWVGGDVWGAGTFPGDLVTENRIAMAVREQQTEAQDTHFRSAREVMHYYIEATDGDIGHVEDFILDDETWEIRYMVIDTKNLVAGEKSLSIARMDRPCELERFESLC